MNRQQRQQLRRLRSSIMSTRISIWSILGISFYTCLWFVALNDTTQNYNPLVTLNQQQEQHNKLMEQRQLEIRRTMLEERKLRKEQRKEQKLRGSTSSNNNNDEDGQQENDSSKKSKQRNSDDDIPPLFGVWASFMLMMSYYRIRMEPRLRRLQQQQQQRFLRERRRGTQQLGLSPSEQQEAVRRTLRRINQERIANGQETISEESYQAFQHLLMTDRSIWRVLATPPQEQNRQHQRPPGATQAELQQCPTYTIPSQSQGGHGDCIICLTSYQANDTVRQLPCGHAFHIQCIDQWLQQSVLCPICKTSLAIDGSTGGNESSETTPAGQQQEQPLRNSTAIGTNSNADISTTDELDSIYD